MVGITIGPEQRITPCEAAGMFLAAHRREVKALDEAQATALAAALRRAQANALSLIERKPPPEDAEQLLVSEEISRTAHQLARALRDYAAKHGAGSDDMRPLWRLFGGTIDPGMIEDRVVAVERLAVWSDATRKRMKDADPLSRGPDANSALTRAVDDIAKAFEAAGGRRAASRTDDGTPCTRFIAAVLERTGLGQHSSVAIWRRLKASRT